MISTQKMASLYGLLRNQHVIDVLNDLVEGQKSYCYFIEKYSRAVSWPLRHLADINAIQKLLTAGNLPKGYVLTDYGRWMIHSYNNFEKELENLK